MKIKNFLIFLLIYFNIMILIIFYRSFYYLKSLFFKIFTAFIFIVICVSVAYLAIIAIKYKEKYQELKNG